MFVSSANWECSTLHRLYLMSLPGQMDTVATEALLPGAILGLRKKPARFR
jgi:hypothetical protein